MKFTKPLFSVLLLLAILLVSCSTNQSKKMENAKTLRHLVFFKFKDSASPEEIKVINDAFIALPESIPVIRDFEWGLNNSPENLNQDLTHCYMVTFSSEADREIYLPHPSHKAFVDKLTPILDKVVVLDYFAQ
jgi:hypothetical protein